MTTFTLVYFLIILLIWIKIYFMNYDGRSQPVRIKKIYYRVYYTKLYVISVIT